MIIEFFGVPGGGKTRLLREVAALMPDAVEIAVPLRRAVAYAVLCFAFRHPFSFCVWMGELVIHANGLFRYKLGLLFRSMAARTKAENADSAKFAFIDEGLLQRMLTIFDRPLSLRHAAFVLKATPFPHATVMVHGGEFQRFTAAKNRFNSPRVKKGERHLQEWMQNVRKNAETIGSLLPRFGSVVSCTRGAPDADPVLVSEQIRRQRR